MWVAYAAAGLATSVAARDARAAWTILVGVTTFAAATAAVVLKWLDAHPDRAERKRAAFDAEVTRIVGRYEAERAAALKRRGRTR